MKKMIFTALMAGVLVTIGQAQWLKVEIDVAPIKEEYGNPGTQFCDMGACTWVDYQKESPIWGEMKPYRRTRLTCADKTRFLMTAEDGSKHCIRLANQQQDPL